MLVQDFNAYDIHLNSNNDLIIAKYLVSDEAVTDVNGKSQTYRSYHYAGFEIPENIDVRLAELVQEGYLPMNRFQPARFDVEVKNPLVYAKALLLGYHHQMLEKFYQVGSGYDYDVTTYITYVHMTTGKVSVLKLDNIKFCSGDKIKELEDSGFIPFERSFYYAYSKENEDHLTKSLKK